MISIFIWILAILGVAISVISVGTFAIALPEESSNITGSTFGSESGTMLASNFTFDNQTSNRTEETPTLNTTSQDKLARGIVITNTSISFPYEVTVRFDSITVHNNHEFFSNGNAEYDLSALVQGNRIDLTEYSARQTHVGSEMPSTGLGDASPGETIYFNPEFDTAFPAEVTVSLPDTLPLSIFTVGEEVDQCGRVDFDHLEDKRQAMVEVFKDNNLNWFVPINDYIDNARTGGDYQPPYTTLCGTDHNEKLGNIIEFYNPVDNYGAGAHTIVSNVGDYTLRYTITVKPSPNP